MTRYPLAALAALALSALAPQAAGATVPEGAGGPVQIASQVRGLAVTPLTALPAAPAGAADRQGCEHLLATPGTAAGRAVAAKGWAVTGEVAIGAFQAVSFVGGFEPGTSGSCALTDGNIGFFSGARLIGLLYVPRGQALSIGRIVGFGADGGRIWDGDFLSQPVADLHALGTEAIVASPLATEETACGGAVAVPYVNGLPITVARRLLADHGWLPVDHGDPAARDGYPKDLAAAGLTEVEDCAGTGFGFCAFDYRAKGAALSVVTAGDPGVPPGPSVSGYSIACDAR
ncbi:hypothetical protein [Zavarzinia sp.]|uniref:hypothetical protein n=1 Tax=Zavarzinia sp. TaxID=2027920 RepID=UPI003569B1A8